MSRLVRSSERKIKAIFLSRAFAINQSKKLRR